MKAGTSIIRCGGGAACISPSSSGSLAMLSDTGCEGVAAGALAARCAVAPGSSGRSVSLSSAPPVGAGHTSCSAASSAAASGVASGRAGNTVTRVATTARWRSIIGL
jgi:hypothetical protein